jgi:uncharacterized protein with PIN domain
VEVSRILLDTSAYSAYIGGHPDLQEPVRHASMVHLSAVAVGELLAGFLKGGRRRQSETRLREFAAEPRVRVLHLDDETAVRYAAIRDYHFGMTHQGLLALRLLLGDRVMIDMTARDYYVTGVGSDDSRGSEKIFRGNIGATFRISIPDRPVELQSVRNERARA